MSTYPFGSKTCPSNSFCQAPTLPTLHHPKNFAPAVSVLQFHQDIFVILGSITVTPEKKGCHLGHARGCWQNTSCERYLANPADPNNSSHPERLLYSRCSDPDWDYQEGQRVGEPTFGTCSECAYLRGMTTSCASKPTFSSELLYTEG